MHCKTRSDGEDRLAVSYVYIFFGYVESRSEMIQFRISLMIGKCTVTCITWGYYFNGDTR